MIAPGSFVCSLLMAYDRRCVVDDGLGVVLVQRVASEDGPARERTGQLGPTALGSLLAVRMIILQASDCSFGRVQAGSCDTDDEVNSHPFSSLLSSFFSVRFAMCRRRQFVTIAASSEASGGVSRERSLLTSRNLEVDASRSPFQLYTLAEAVKLIDRGRVPD